MTSLKYKILFVILIMTIGVAVVTSNLVMSASTMISNNSEDFNVYFSDVYVLGVRDLSLIKTNTKLSFNHEFVNLGEMYSINYYITNGSKNYDADIDVICTGDTEYVTYSNVLDSSELLSARSTIGGTIVFTMVKSYVGGPADISFSCEINASAVERTSQNNDEVIPSIERTFVIGEEITIGTEKFNVINVSEDTITMLSKYNLDTSVRQNADQWDFSFSVSNGWLNVPSPQEIDIQTWGGDVKLYVNSLFAVSIITGLSLAKIFTLFLSDVIFKLTDPCVSIFIRPAIFSATTSPLLETIMISASLLDAPA